MIGKKEIKRRTKSKMLIPIIENRNETNNIAVDEIDDELAVKVKYVYYKYFKENFDYTFGRPQVYVCSQFES